MQRAREEGALVVATTQQSFALVELQTAPGSQQALVDNQIDGATACIAGEAGKEMSVPMSADQRKFWLSKRQALFIELGAIEDMLGLERSVETKREKKESKKFINSERRIK